MAAWAKVEVITNAGPGSWCQHHHKKYRHSIIAAGHQIRAMLGPTVRQESGDRSCSAFSTAVTGSRTM